MSDSVDPKERTGMLKRARLDAGMGFWRLVWIVTLGILLAQIIGVGALRLVRALSSDASTGGGARPASSADLDSDGDGIRDDGDECPYKVGLSAFQGCPRP